MLKTKKISDVIGLDVFTDGGDYFGVIEEAMLVKNKVDGWRVKATKDSFISKALAGARGVIIPHQLVTAIGSVFIVSKAAAPSYGGEEAAEEA